MMNTLRSRGFTLVELLVVISIIGTLSSIVLSSLTTARNKSIDAAAIENLANARSQGELFYSANSDSYRIGTPGLPAKNVCNAAADANGINGINKFVLAAANVEGISTVQIDASGGPGIAVCNALNNAWAAQIPLKTAGVYYCADSSGTKSTSTTALPLLGFGGTACP